MQKQLEDKLLQAQKMESVGRLAGGIAHDFNNYLTTISGQTEMIAQQLPAGSPLKGGLGDIRNSVAKAAGLTRQLMLFSRNQPVNLEPVNVNDIILRLGDVLDDSLDGGVSHSVKLSAGLPAVEADAGNLEHVVLTLVQKAARDLPGEGEVSVATRTAAVDANYSMSHAEAYPGAFVCICVSDTGPDLGEEEALHMFEPFYGVGKDDHSGLGLSVAYGIVMQLGGWIEVDPTMAGGSRFRVFLPQSSRASRSYPSRRSLKELRGRGERILLVEDEEAVRSTVERMLKESGYKVAAAADAEQAFDIFVGNAGNFQLVLSDIVLPGESGVQLVEHLRLHKSKLPVILSSGYTDRADDLKIIRERDYRFLQKPFSLPELLRLIRDLLGPVSMS